MRTKLITIGNSMGVRLPKALIEQFELEGEIELNIEERGILISPAKKTRHDWEQRFEAALKKGETPEKDMFNGSQNDFDKTEWTW